MSDDRRRPRRSSHRRGRAGQSIVEFALVVPIMVILMVAIVDLARIYTTMVSIESAAREAADYGTFGSNRWAAGSAAFTESEMKLRACTASSTLTDYVGSPDPADTTDCTNPTMSYALSTDRGANWFDCTGVSNCSDTLGLACDDSTREPPCWLQVTLRYDFDLLVPLNLEVFGVRYGLPTTITFERNAIFTMTDLNLPSPTP